MGQTSSYHTISGALSYFGHLLDGLVFVSAGLVGLPAVSGSQGARRGCSPARQGDILPLPGGAGGGILSLHTVYIFAPFFPLTHPIFTV